MLRCKNTKDFTIIKSEYSSNYTMKGILIQLFSSLILSLGNFLIGFSIVWPSYTLELFRSPQSPFGRITSTESGMVGSLPMLGVLTTVLLASMMSDKFGKTKIAILCGFTFILSWSIITTASNITMVFIGRFMLGIGMGMQCVVTMPFLSEISQASIRGTMSSIVAFAYIFGTLISYLSGWQCSYEVINYLNLGCSVLFSALVCFLKESPAWLLGEGREKEAIASLKYYRGTSETTVDILHEIEVLKSLRQTETVITDKTDAEQESLNQKEVTQIEISAWKLLWTSKAAWRALVIVSTHVILLVFAGNMAVQTYAAQLFTAAAPSMSASGCSVLLACAFLLGCVLALVLSDIVGRRPLMITSCILSAASLLVLASLLRWSWGPEWMAAATVLVFACLFMMGFGNVPYIQLAESFVPKIKSLTQTIVLILECMSNFIVLTVFDGMVLALGLDGTFVMFAAVCALTALVAAAIMHETKGVPIEDIVASYERGYLYRRKKSAG